MKRGIHQSVQLNFDISIKQRVYNRHDQLDRKFTVKIVHNTLFIRTYAPEVNYTEI